MIHEKERFCFTGPNALIDASAFLGDAAGNRLVCSMTPLQVACYSEDPVNLSKCLANSQTHCSPHPLSVFPGPLSLCCLWKAAGSASAGSLCAGISYGSLSCAEALLLHGADPEGIDDRVIERLRIGPSIMSTASSAYDKDCAKVTIAASSPYAKLRTVFRPLHLALLCNNTPLVKLLLKHRASVAAQVQAALWCCCCTWSVGGLAALALLDETSIRSAASMALDSSGHTAMHIAVLHCPRDEYAMPDSVCEVGERLVHLLDMLAFYGCDVNARDADGFTALHLAWRFGLAEAAAHLLEVLHADSTVLDNQGRPPLGAHSSGLPSGAVLLAGLTVNTHFPHSWSSLRKILLCVLRHDSHAVLGRHCGTNGTLTTALHLLCESFSSLMQLYPINGIVTLAEAILEHSPDCINARDEHGKSPLFIACSAPCCPAFVDVLLTHGADPWARCSDRKKLGQSGEEVNILQQLLAMPEPYYGIGDVALRILTSIGHFDVNELSQPYEQSKPFTDSPVVRTHPYWLSFYDAVSPAATDKESRAREAEKFHASLRTKSASGWCSCCAPNAARTPAAQLPYDADVTVPVEICVTPTQLPRSVQMVLEQFRLTELNDAKFASLQFADSSSNTTEHDIDTVEKQRSFFDLMKSLSEGGGKDEPEHLVMRYLREREEEENFRRRCWEDPFAMGEMRRQHMRTLQLAAARKAELKRLMDSIHERSQSS